MSCHCIQLACAHHQLAGAHHQLAGAHHQLTGAHHQLATAHHQLANAHRSPRWCPSSDLLLPNISLPIILVVQDNEVVSALMALFANLAAREHRQDRCQPADPTQLRHALARLPGGRFQVGQSPSTLCSKYYPGTCSYTGTPSSRWAVGEYCGIMHIAVTQHAC